MHQRGLQAPLRPSSPTLRGAFDGTFSGSFSGSFHQPQQQQQLRNNMSATTASGSTTTYTPKNGTWLPMVEREGADTGFPTVSKAMGVEGADLKAAAFSRSECEVEEEEEEEPEVRYRVRFTDASVGPNPEGRGRSSLPRCMFGQEAHESPCVNVRVNQTRNKCNMTKTRVSPIPSLSYSVHQSTDYSRLGSHPISNNSLLRLRDEFIDWYRYQILRRIQQHSHTARRLNVVPRFSPNYCALFVLTTEYCPIYCILSYLLPHWPTYALP